MSTRTGRPAATSVSSARSGKRFPMSLGRLLPFLAPAPLVGGQAVMEGVMMRNGDVYALAVRTADGNISVENRPWFSLTRSELLKKPFLRGFPTLIETLVNGIKALNLSAERSTEGTGEELKDWQLVLTLIVSLLFAVGLFVVVPHLLSIIMNWIGLGGDVEGILLLDVTPLSLGIETLGGVCTKLIDRNTTIPVKKSQIFSTAADNQTSVEVNVLQGEREMAAANKSLGRFHLDGIAPARRGVPQIEVTFAIDANGIVTVSAKDLGTGNQQEITISSTTNMSEDEIRRAMEDARRYEAQDKARKEASGIRNEAEKLIYETEQALGRDKTISHEDKKKVKDDISALRKAVNKTKPESITTEQAAEIARLAEALKQSAKAIRTEE